MKVTDKKKGGVAYETNCSHSIQSMLDKPIPESEMSVEALAQIFNQAFMRNQIDEQGNLLVDLERLKLRIIIEGGRKFLKFLAIYGLKSAPSDRKDALINSLNSSLIFVKFSVPYEQDPEALVAEYDLIYENGVMAFQIIETARLMGRIIPNGLANYDKFGILA